MGRGELVANNPNPTEDLGYAFVQQVAASAAAIWRRQAEKDIGVDGLLELERKDGASAYIAVQVKSGKSYFSRVHDNKVRVNLGRTLQRLNRLTLPAIIILYHPLKKFGCWEHVDHYLLENSDAAEKGYIDVPLNKIFDTEALNELRSDTRQILTPKLSNEDVREFLTLNRSLSLSAFVALAASVLNHTAIRSRPGLPPLDFLLESGLIALIDLELPGPPFWEPTDKGKRYVEFLLGDRYVLPFALLQPTREITSRDVYACMNLEAHLAAAGGKAVKGMR